MNSFIVRASAIVSLMLIAGQADAEERFSRSRWISERVGRMWFSGGVMPSGPRPIVPAPVLPLPLLSTEGLPNYRVSHDIVPGPVGDAQAETQTEPYVTINPSNPLNILAGYQDNRFVDGGARALTYAYSVDGGKRWIEAMLPNLTIASGGSFERASDPWVAFGPSNRAYFASLGFNETSPRNGVYVSASSDGGKTFGPPVTVHEFLGVTGFDDKESIAVDTGGSSPYRGYVYVGWDDANAGIEYISRSTDKGRSFRPPIALEREGWNIGIVPVVSREGIVYAVWVHGDPSTGATLIRYCKSIDGGATWGTRSTVASVVPAGVAGMRTGDIPLPSVAIDPKSGAVYVAWQEGGFVSGVAHVALARSTNRGNTWSVPLRVSDGPDLAANFTPAVAVNGEGKVAVCYYSIRNDPDYSGPAPLWVDEYIAVSSNKGRTFGASRRVSQTSFNVSYAAEAGGYFLGDYQGMVGDSTVFHPFFVATLKNSKIDPSRKQPDAFASRVTP